MDVLRAPVSEIEQYQRVQLRGLVAADIDGRAVNDIVHLIAELLDDATTFSSPDTEVVVTCRLLSGGATVEIQGNGIGMSTEDFAEANEKLLNSRSAPRLNAPWSARYNAEGRLSGWRNCDTAERIEESAPARRTHRNHRQGARSATEE